MKKYLNDDGSVETAIYDSSTGLIHVTKQTDVSHIIEANKRKFNAADRRYRSEVFNEVADIPIALAEQWCAQKGIKYSEFLNNPKVLKMFLNDPDNSLCRTKPGKIM